MDYDGHETGPFSLRGPPRRVGVAEAKSRLSEVLRDAASGPTVIHSRGCDLAVLLAVEQYERLVGEQAGGRAGAALLERLEKVKRRHAGGVEEFDPAPVDLQPVNPFGRTRKARGGGA